MSEGSFPHQLQPESSITPQNAARFSTLKRWLKFNLVGGIGIAVQFGALFLLKSVLHFDYLLAAALAVETAVVHNFVWHEQFTWVDRTTSDRTTPDRTTLDRAKLDRTRAEECETEVQPRWRASLQRLLRFNVANGAVSILGNVSLMRVMVGEGHMNYLLANAIAIALCSVANFVVSDVWVFSAATRQQERL